MRPRPIRRLFVAARGMVARRVIRSARAAGIESVVLIRESDAESAWPDEADYAVYLPGGDRDPWPSPDQVIEAAVDAGCDAVHPGWDVLARSPLLTERLAASGLAGAGPNTIQLAAVADRSILRRLAEQLEIPAVPGSDPIDDASVAETWLVWTGLPAIVKSVDEVHGPRAARIDAGPAGRALLAERLAQGPVVLERLVVGAREIEVPLVGDGQGDIVVLGDGDITVRVDGRRALVEAPTSGLSQQCRDEIYANTVEIAQHLQWLGLGAARFLVTPDGRPYFLQFRPGLQPWHAVYESLLGVDLVEVQLRLAAGEGLGWGHDDVVIDGHAIGLRLVAGAHPPSSTVSRLQWPPDARIDAGPFEGDAVTAGEELGSVTVQAPTRQACIVRLKSAMDHLAVEGPDVGLEAIRRLIDSPTFWRGPVDRDSLAEILGAPAPPVARR